MLVNLLIEIAEYNWQVSLSGHLFDQFLINEALDIIEAAGGTFHLVNCHVGQSVKAVSFSELEVSSPVFQTQIFMYVPLKCSFSLFRCMIVKDRIIQFLFSKTC